MFYPRFNTHYANSFLRDLRSFQRVANRIYDLEASTDNDVSKVILTDDGAEVYLQLPGYTEEQLEVEAIRDRVTIKGSASSAPDTTEESGTDIQRSIANGAFERRFKLPFTIEPRQSQASFEHGILKLSFKKPLAQQAKQIPIESN